MRSSDQIKKFILDNLTRHQRDIIHTAIRRFGISRQAILKHMHTLIAEKQVIAHGKTRDRYYELKPQVNFSKTIDIDSEFFPQMIIKNYILPHLSTLSKNIHQICEFSIEAILNNIVDHANATNLYYKLYITYKDVHIILSDNGDGLFEHIQAVLKLKNTQIAAVELAKGHVTTDPNHHSGDELITVLHLFDKVTIDASGKSLTFINDKQYWLIDHSTQKQGTRIHLQINPGSRRTCHEVFQKLFHGEHQSVRIPINLLKVPGDELVNSREQAQSILRNITDYKTIEFDFNNVDLIGPAFADELIRKTRVINQFADIKWINCNETVDVMMLRAVSRFS